jgi:hypothetical protein
MYKYWGFGLNIISEIEFPEMYPTVFDNADLQITIGNLTPSAKEKALSTTNFIKVINDTEIIFQVKDVATYHAVNGNRISIEITPNNSDMRSVRLYILATAMAAVLLQRKRLPFHASAIIRDNHLSLITGDSGAGKSTSIAGLIKNGHKIFSDDVIVLHKNEEGNILATASYPMIKLWNDTVKKLKHEMFNDKSFVVKPGMDKYGIFFHKDFDTKSYPIENILILKKGNGSIIQIKKLQGGEAFSAVTEQIYRKGLVKSSVLKKMSFDVLAALLKKSNVYEITRPIDGDIDQMLLKLEELL